MQRSIGLKIGVTLAFLIAIAIIAGQMLLTSHNTPTAWNNTLHFILGVIAGITMVLALIGVIKLRHGEDSFII